MRRGKALAMAGALLIGGCSGIPLIGSSDGPHLTNPAVEACKRKASELGYDGVGERQSAPGPEGRYTVQLDVRENQGYGQVTCAFDPATGADVPPRKAPAK